VIEPAAERVAVSSLQEPAKPGRGQTAVTEGPAAHLAPVELDVEDLFDLLQLYAEWELEVRDVTTAADRGKVLDFMVASMALEVAMVAEGTSIEMMSQWFADIKRGGPVPSMGMAARQRLELVRQTMATAAPVWERLESHGLPRVPIPEGC